MYQILCELCFSLYAVFFGDFFPPPHFFEVIFSLISIFLFFCIGTLISLFKIVFNIDSNKKYFKMQGRENTYLTHVCRHRWSRQIMIKVNVLGAFSQHCSFHQL